MGFSLKETTGYRLRRWLAQAVRNDAIHFLKADLPGYRPPDEEDRTRHLDYIVSKIPFEFRTYVETRKGRVRLTDTASVHAIRDDLHVDAFGAGIMLITEMFRFQGMFPTELNHIEFLQLDADAFSKHCDLMRLIRLEYEFRQAHSDATRPN